MRDTNIKAIQTRYAGHHFRSRLEARWAVFFDSLGVKWEYEKEGYDLSEIEVHDYNLGRYLPDFWLPEFDTWVEIKGGLPEPHWERTLPEAQMWALVYETGASFGWVFFGLPDIETPCSCVYRKHKEEKTFYPEDAHRGFGSVCNMLEGLEISDEHFSSAKSARFEFGECPR